MRYSELTGVESPYNARRSVRHQIRYMMVPGSMFHQIHEENKAGVLPDPAIFTYGLAIFIEAARIGGYVISVTSAIGLVRNLTR